MNHDRAVIALSALAQEHRLRIFRLLVKVGPSGLPAGQIATRIGIAPSALSFHLAQMERAGLLLSRRAQRHIYYAVSVEGTRRLLAFLTEDCCQGRPEMCGNIGDWQAPMNEDSRMSDGIFNVLFLCTGNSARSIMAEAILNHTGTGKFRAYSAGSQPKGAVNPLALAFLAKMKHPTGGLRSKSWDEFAGPDAVPLDFVFTLCDSGANEVCPIWPGQPMTAHWGMPDPAAATGSDAVRFAAFADTYRLLSQRIGIFTSLPIASLDRLSLQRRVVEIGKAAATEPA